MAIVTESSGNGGGNTGSGPENEYARVSVVASALIYAYFSEPALFKSSRTAFFN